MHRSRRRIAAHLALSLLCLLPVHLSAQAGAGAQRAVLVTGASSGIGRKITESLAAQGHFVYAGARKAEDIAELSAIPNVQGVRLDVTVQGDIDAAVETVRRGGRGFHGVVNNAGIAIVAPLIDVDEKELAGIFDVNVFGVVPGHQGVRAAADRVEGTGRHDQLDLGHSVRSVLRPLQHEQARGRGVRRCTRRGDGALRRQVQPHRTGQLSHREIGRNTTAQVEAALARLTGTPFEEQARRMVAAMGNYDNYPSPGDVAAAASHAMFDPKPRMRYMVVPAARQAVVTIRKAIEELVQLNQGHAFTIPRDSLVKMLDEALARAKR